MLCLIGGDARSGIGGEQDGADVRVCSPRGHPRGASLRVARRRGNFGAATLPSRSSIGRGGRIRRRSSERAARVRRRRDVPRRDIGPQSKRSAAGIRVHRARRPVVGHGARLLQHDPLFRETVEACDRLFSQRSGWSLLEELARLEDCSRINETVVAQPAIFALQVALAERLAAWGIRPEAVVGHSIGEIAAAHVAGALSLPQAVDVVYHRSRLQERARRQGGMAAVGLAAGRVRNYLEKFDGQLEVAAINGPELVSIAGPRALLDQFVAEVGREQADVLCQILRVDYAPQPPDGCVHRRARRQPSCSAVAGRGCSDVLERHGSGHPR